MSDRLPAVRHVALGLSRATLGVVFLYFGWGELYGPGAWVGYMPPVVPAHLAVWLVLVHGFALFVVGGALVVGTRLRWAYPLAVLLMGSVAGDLLLSSGPSAIWFRDLGLTALAVATWAGGQGLALDDLDRIGPKAASRPSVGA